MTRNGAAALKLSWLQTAIGTWLDMYHNCIICTTSFRSHTGSIASSACPLAQNLLPAQCRLGWHLPLPMIFDCFRTWSQASLGPHCGYWPRHCGVWGAPLQIREEGATWAQMHTWFVTTWFESWKCWFFMTCVNLSHRCHWFWPVSWFGSMSQIHLDLMTHQKWVNTQNIFEWWQVMTYLNRLFVCACLSVKVVGH